MATLDALAPDEQHRHQSRLLQVYLAMGEEVPPDLLVHHAAAVADIPLLLQHAPRAARRAAAVGAHKEAAAQLAIALRHVAQASPEQAAELFQDWAYETGLFEVNDAVLEARREAVRRWRALGRADRVGDNLRWLWRLHWYRGEVDAAEAAAKEAIEILEAIPPSAELAQAYALRAHMHLLKGQRSDSIAWGQRAIVMAQSFGDADCQAQALVSVATSMLFSGDDHGRALMDQALTLALSHGLHEQAARVYTNYSEYAIVMRDWPLAEKLVLEGLAFDVKNHLESWTGYLSGRHAQLRLEQGRLSEAQTLARGALDIPHRTVLMRLPAMTTLAITQSRLGADDARALLTQALQAAVAMREQQRLTPVRLGLIEHLYLKGELEEARAQVQAMLDFGARLLRPWDAGALRVWGARLAMPLPAEVGAHPTRAQVLELAGDPAAAAALLDELQAPFDAALCRLVAGVAVHAGPAGDTCHAGHAMSLQSALTGFDAFGAQAGVQAAQRLAQLLGVSLQPPKARRGPYQAARNHPLGLTRKELQVLKLLADGASNAEIATAQSRSVRTVEHHVSSILGKLNAAHRLEAILRVMAEPWILGNDE
jgi:DNA-binding CsgD family transcriptional regulator/tetratricopeptide (TPR) repeat protein